MDKLISTSVVGYRGGKRGSNCDEMPLKLEKEEMKRNSNTVTATKSVGSIYLSKVHS